MKQEFTSNDIIRDLYNESSYLENMALQKARNNNAELANEYQSLAKAKQILSSIELEPSNLSIQNILNFSASSKFEANLG